MKRLNMWQRMGIVVSILWLIGGGLYTITSRGREATKFANADYILCMESGPHDEAQRKECQSHWLPDYKAILSDEWEYVGLFVVAPLVAAWIVIIVGLYTGRWVLAGRRPRST